MRNTRAIDDLWRTMADAWGRGDAEAFASVFTEQVDYVTVSGEERTGRAQVQAGHALLFTAAYAATRLVPEGRLIRPLTENVYLVHVVCTVVPSGLRTHAQAVVVRREDRWQIAAYHGLLA